jgi:hypothetical protein
MCKILDLDGDYQRYLELLDEGMAVHNAVKKVGFNNPPLPERKSDMKPTAKPMTAVTQIGDLLTKYGIYRTNKPDNGRRESFNLNKFSGVQRRKIRRLYRQALLENCLTDSSEKVSLVPHGIFTPGSVISLWRFSDYPLAKTMDYFTGPVFKDLSLDEIKKIDKQIQASYAGNTSLAGEFWGYVLKNKLYLPSDAKEHRETLDKKGIFVICQFAESVGMKADRAEPFEELYPKNILYARLFKILGIRMMRDDDGSLLFKTPGCSHLITSDENPFLPKLPRTTNVDPMINWINEFIEHITCGGTQAEDTYGLPKLLVSNVTLDGWSQIQRLYMTFTEGKEELSHYRPEIENDDRGKSPMVSLIHGVCEVAIYPFCVSVIDRSTLTVVDWIPEEDSIYLVSK